MTLLGLIAILLIIGVVLALFPVDGMIRNVIIALVLIAIILAIFHGGYFGNWRF